MKGHENYRVHCYLKEIMAQRNITVDELHEQARISRETISQLRGNSFKGVSTKAIARLSGALGVAIGEMLEVLPEDIWLPIRLTKEVTIHFGLRAFTEPRPADCGKDEAIISRQFLGSWDFRAFNWISEYLLGLNLDIRIRFEQHITGAGRGIDPAVRTSAQRVFEGGNHIVIGSQVANQFTEEVVCHAYGVPPYNPQMRDAFPYGFEWDHWRQVRSSFGWQGHGKQFGIAALPSNKVVASCVIVPSGEGSDGALILVYRVFQMPNQREMGDDDERVVICLLGRPRDLRRGAAGHQPRVRRRPVSTGPQGAAHARGRLQVFPRGKRPHRRTAARLPRSALFRNQSRRRQRPPRREGTPLRISSVHRGSDRHVSSKSGEAAGLPARRMQLLVHPSGEPDKSRRMGAARGIAEIAGCSLGLLSICPMTDPTTIKRLRAAIRDHDPEVRAQGVDALLMLTDAPGLLAALGSRDRYVRARAARGLTACRGWRVELRLAAAAFDADTEVRCEVAAALAQRGRLAARVLAHLAYDPHAVVRYGAVTALARVRSRRAQRALRYVETHDREGWLRDAASALLQRAGPAMRDPAKKSSVPCVT